LRVSGIKDLTYYSITNVYHSRVDFKPENAMIKIQITLIIIIVTVYLLMMVANFGKQTSTQVLNRQVMVPLHQVMNKATHPLTSLARQSAWSSV